MKSKILAILFLGFLITAVWTQDASLVIESPLGQTSGIPWEIHLDEVWGPHRITIGSGELDSLEMHVQNEQGDWSTQSIPWDKDGLFVRFKLQPPEGAFRVLLWPVPKGEQTLLAFLDPDDPWVIPGVEEVVPLGVLQASAPILEIPGDLPPEGSSLRFHISGASPEQISLRLYWESPSIPVPVLLYSGPPRELPLYGEGEEGERLWIGLEMGPPSSKVEVFLKEL